MRKKDEIRLVISDKLIVQHLVAFCKQKGIKNIVFSPGSRNAPLVISFTQDSFFNCKTIVDERSAAFIALGMSIELDEPVLICCTSGSAALNYAPAISEAHYQKVPLFVVTADRPQKWIDNGEGQSIQQINVFANYISKLSQKLKGILISGRERSMRYIFFSVFIQDRRLFFLV